MLCKIYIRFYCLITLIFISCNSNSTEISAEKIFQTTYELNIAENEIYNKIILDQINSKHRELNIIFPEIEKCRTISQKYFDYLKTIENEIKNSGNDIFFNGYSYSKKGTEFIENSELYKSEIEKLTKSKDFLKRFDLVFNTHYVTNENNVAIGYLDYFIRGYPTIQSVSFISDRKRRILEFEIELIDKIQIEKLSIANTGYN